MHTPEGNKSRQKRAREYAQKAKDVPCADCGVRYPYYVMDFDHLDSKNFTINKFIKGGPSLKTLQNEIDTCEVVCSNCHRVRTYNRIYGDVAELAYAVGSNPAPKG